MEHTREAQHLNEIIREDKLLFTPEPGKSPPQGGLCFDNLCAKKVDKKNKINREYDTITQRIASHMQ